MIPTPELVQKLISEQFPQYAHLPISEVERQGHDNYTYRLGEDMLVRMPSAVCYAEKIAIEYDLLPKLAKYLSFQIPTPLRMGKPSQDYPYPFSIYRWLSGKSLNLLTLNESENEQLASDLAQFLKELQAITDVSGPLPGQHNFWRGDHISVYDKDFRAQIAKLADIIDGDKAMDLWERACATKWEKAPVWIHGDFAIGNFLIENGKLSAVIDFGGVAIGDPACDLVIAWTYFSGKARSIFINENEQDPDTWLRARAWALWKATFELCELNDHQGRGAALQMTIIDNVMNA